MKGAHRNVKRPRKARSDKVSQQNLGERWTPLMECSGKVRVRCQSFPLWAAKQLSAER
jgi:hypothetical protein